MVFMVMARQDNAYVPSQHSRARHSPTHRWELAHGVVDVVLSLARSNQVKRRVMLVLSITITMIKDVHVDDIQTIDS
jgi:KaiC/GvpD/RAD55 family RecA-like ATPase